MTLDTKYWSTFYTGEHTLEPSAFSQFVLDFFWDQDQLNILDVGCGNGRDSYALAKKHNVTGIDTSSYLPEATDRCNFETADLTTYDKADFNLIYSRFSFHALDDKQQLTFLKSIRKPGTYLAIECRSDVGIDELRVHNKRHFRNFVSHQRLDNQLSRLGFIGLYAMESTGFAPYQTEDPVCIRTIVQKI